MQIRMPILLILTLIIINSCERDIGNFCYQMGRESGYLPIQQIGEKLVKDTVDCWLKVTDSSSLWFRPSFYQIDDQQTFEKLVNCNCATPEFNFRDYTLLMGYFFTPNYKATITKQDVKIDCYQFEQHLSYRVYVDIVSSDTVRFLVQYHAVIPKLPEGFKPSHRIFRNRI